MRILALILALSLPALPALAQNETGDAAAATAGLSGDWRSRLNFRPAPLIGGLTTAAPVLGFTCNPLFCACRGDSDCNDMFTTTVCGPRAICIDNVCYCVRN